ncbi:fatty acid--CoA ligase family protein, partial [Stella sp.]|uniref:ANL family adenylate-forming protein n=1 Tax=Stella sp. TaxID=2912054 RepID=UPI0035B1D3F1
MTATDDGAEGWIGCGLDALAAARPQAPAIVTPDGTVAWADFHRRVQIAAAGFHGRGVAAGAVAAIRLRDRPADLAALFALLRLGAAALCLDPEEPDALNAELMRRAGARFHLGDAGDPVPPGVTAIDLGAPDLATPDRAGIAPPDAPPLPPPPGPDTVAFVARSSGTAGGFPKLSPMTHRLHVRRAHGMVAAFPRGPGDRYLALVRIAFAFGRNAALRALESGGAVILPPPLRRAGDLAAAARRHGATWTVMTPAHLRELAASDAPSPILGTMRILASTAALSAEDRRRVRARVSPNLLVGYGSNEVGTLTLAQGDDHEARPGSVGRLLPGVEAEVVDGDGRPLPPGETGELRFRSPDFPQSYVDALPGQASRFAGGWYYPGDVGRIDADGYLHLRGRADDVINVGGVKVYPADIEAALADHPAVAEAAAVGLAAGRTGGLAAVASGLRAPCT